MSKQPYDFESKVAGIPCKVRVTYYTPYVPASYNSPAEGGDFNFQILDKKGYRAKWLEAKVTERDVERLAVEYDEYQKAQLEDY